MKKRSNKQEAQILPGREKEFTLNDVLFILREFTRTIIMCSSGVADAVGNFTLFGEDAKAVEQFFDRVAIYVSSCDYTRGDIVKDSEGNEAKMKAIEVGQRIVDFLGLNHWVLLDVLSGRAKIDEDGNITPEPHIPFDQLPKKK